MLSTLASATVAELGRHRWMVALLAEFDRRRGARFVELLHALGAPRDSLVRTLDAAIEAGWLARNPGHGHPLRPEYVLTDQGKTLASVCRGIVDSLTAAGLAPIALSRWGLPVLRALAEGSDRFNLLVRGLAPATPRALSQALKDLAANDLVAREIEDAFPPTSRYRLTERGLRLTA